MEPSSDCFIWKLLLSHHLIFRPYKYGALLIRGDLRLWVDLLLDVEMHDVFTFSTDGELYLCFALLMSNHANDFCKFNFHAGPTTKPIKVFLVWFVAEKVDPAIFRAGAEVVVTEGSNAWIYWWHLISAIWRGGRRLNFQIGEEIKHLEDQEVALFCAGN